MVTEISKKKKKKKTVSLFHFLKTQNEEAPPKGSVGRSAIVGLWYDSMYEHMQLSDPIHDSLHSSSFVLPPPHLTDSSFDPL